MQSQPTASKTLLGRSSGLFFAAAAVAAAAADYHGWLGVLLL
jgi:hypothetical protein